MVDARKTRERQPVLRDEDKRSPQIRKSYTRPRVIDLGLVVNVTLGPSLGLDESGAPFTLKLE